MSLWNLFAGPSAEKLAQQAESLVNEQQWGPAKVTLERALEKAADPDLRAHLEAEIRICCDHLAQSHLEQAVVLEEGGHHQDATDLYQLAREVARTPQLRNQAEEGLTRLASSPGRAAVGSSADAVDAGEPVLYSPQPPPSHSDAVAGAVAGAASDLDTEQEATFWALIGTLPEDMQDAYEDYGEPFRSGYLALNRGEFKRAVDLLEAAHQDHPQAGAYIPLELAAAYAHTGRSVEAGEMLKEFLHYHPDILPAYQLFCELLWEMTDFNAVEALLGGVPETLVDTVALVLLRGENYLRAGQLEAGIEYLEGVLGHYGWSDPIAQLLATLYTDSGDSERAHALLGEILQRCQSCHSRVDPMVKHHFAELSYAGGQRDTRLLELYLSLAQEVPHQADLYFRRVSAIYAEQGHAAEAQRFLALAERSLDR